MSRVGGVEEVPVGRLTPHPGNPRRIDQAELEQLKSNLEADPDMLQARPVIALPDGTVVAGNQRLRAAVELGWETIPAVFADLDEQTARLWMLRDNTHAGEFDWAEVARLLDGADAALAGFAGGDLEAIRQGGGGGPVAARPGRGAAGA